MKEQSPWTFMVSAVKLPCCCECNDEPTTDHFVSTRNTTERRNRYNHSREQLEWGCHSCASHERRDKPDHRRTWVGFRWHRNNNRHADNYSRYVRGSTQAGNEIGAAMC